MKKLTKHIAAMLLGILMLFSAMPLSAFAANNDTNYSKYSCPTRVLKYQKPQMHGNDVKWFQCAINYLVGKKAISTPLLDVDGYFGQASKKAVEAFQTAYRGNPYYLSTDGCFGPASRKAMVEILKSYSSSCTNHKWSLTKTVAATCTTAGTKYYKCSNSNCTATKTETIPATGHSYNKVTYDGPFKVETCSCGNEKRERTTIYKMLTKDYGWSPSRANDILNDYKEYYTKLNPNTNTNIKSTVTNVGKVCSVTSNLLKTKGVKEQFQNAANTCDYLNLIIDVQTMMRGGQSGSSKMDATLAVLSDVTSKVDFGGYFSSALDTIKTASNATIKAVCQQYIKQTLNDMEDTSFSVTVNGKTLDLKSKQVTAAKIENDLDIKNAAFALLTDHYNKINSTATGKNLIKNNMTNNDYFNLFMDVKRREAQYGKNFDAVVDEIIRSF